MPIGLTIAVRALDRCRTALADGGADCTMHEGALLAPPERAHGAVVEFVHATEDA